MGNEGANRGGGTGPTTAGMQIYGAPASPDAPRGTRAGLVLLYAPSFAQFAPAYLLTGRDLILGREPSSGICIPQGAVSRQHARIRLHDGRWMLTDLGSRNGTLVDGGFVDEVALEHLHEIRIGDAIFKFVEHGAESYARFRIDGEVDGGTAAELERLARRRELIVGGFQIDSLARSIDRVAPSGISVVLLGESGTGKEVFAQHLHARSGRRGALQAINCAALPANLLESELFGYRRGAFSGADRDKTGLIRAAEGGTLFLDEVGDMPLEAQSKLLRVLQSKEVVPLGATSPERVDLRVVCATHRDLVELQRAGRFRGDLYARLNEFAVSLPPLRERKEDLYALCRALLARHGRPDLGLAFPFMTGLLHYDFPFNVRELEAIVKRGVALCEEPALDRQHLSDEIKQVMEAYACRHPRTSTPYPPASARDTIAPAIATAPRGAAPSEPELRALLSQHRGNVAAVGREFGKERMQVHRWMKRYGIDVEEYR